jgi:5-formyltetrahydrofolate cyclo-ligase
MISKNALRRHFKNLVIDQRLKTLEEDYILDQAKFYITKNSPKIIGLYYPLSSELNITPLHNFCQTKGIKTAYPATQNGEMIYHLVNDLRDLQKGNFGFLEPSGKHHMVKPDLLIVPGLAFNKNGARLGRGQGHFDKYIARHTPKTLALAFSWMIIDDIPLEAHDQIIDTVLWVDL